LQGGLYLSNYNKRVLIVDGMALLFRAFYATALRGNYMINSKGIPTNGIHGFVKYFWDAYEKFEPTHVVCCWDMGSKTFRTELYDSYKGNRDEPPVELIPQFELVKEMTTAFNIPNVGIKGFEADDCIGTLAKQYKSEAEVYILSGDRDLLQLADDHTHVVIMKKGQGNYEVINKSGLFDLMNLTPEQFIDMKGLMGDSSDNYPGVKGIGEKTALKLISQYESIDGILENLDTLSNGVKKKIEADIEMLHLSRKLAEIHCEVPVTCSFESAVWDTDYEKVLQACDEFELKGLRRVFQKMVQEIQA
jgi:5'-3' exonuclease